MLNLITTQDQYEALHKAADTRAKTVRVDAQALTNLLIDHSVLVKYLHDRGTRVATPQSTQPTGRAGRSKAGL